MPPAKHPQRFITIAKAARILKLPPADVLALAETGHLDSEHVGDIRMVSQQSVEGYAFATRNRDGGGAA